MPTALVIGGSGFVGTHTVECFLDHGYDVVVNSRSAPTDPRAEEDDAVYSPGDRTDPTVLESIRDEFDPDVVIDLVALYPRDVESATDIFADCDAYVYVSSASAYAQPVNLPSREDDPLHDYSPAHDTDEPWGAGYSERKAEGDRVCVAASNRGVNAMVVRPVSVYGPGDWSQRHDYWFHRVNCYDEVVVPGDGDSTFHRVFVRDLADALRLVAERGDPGEAYNAAERDTAWLDRTIDLAADILETEVELVHASERELATCGLSPFDFPLYMSIPHVAASQKLADLGWRSTPLREALAVTIDDHLESGRTGTNPPRHAFGVDRATEAQLIDSLRA